MPKSPDLSEPMTPEEFKAATSRISAEMLREANADREAIRKRLANERLGRLMSGVGIPRRYQTATFENSRRDTQPEAWEIAENYAMEFEQAQQNGNGMLLWGGVGTGKTHLACVVASAVIMGGYSAAYTTVFEIVAGVKASWRAATREEGELEFYRSMTKPDLLIIDEIGVQSDTEFERTVISTIVDARNRDCRPIIGISNYSPADMLPIIGKRAFDRITGDGCKIIKFEGQSLRRGG